MARLSDLLGNAKKMDLYRVANDETVPRRGKKKHYTQMSNKEKNYLFNKLKSVKKWGVQGHALDRIKEKGIEATYDDMVSTIHNAIIIEYHVVKFDGMNDERVLLRSKALINSNNNLHVVYSMTRKTIVSVWMNRVNDRHSTLDWKDYDKNIRIIGV